MSLRYRSIECPFQLEYEGEDQDDHGEKEHHFGEVQLVVFRIVFHSVRPDQGSVALVEMGGDPPAFRLSLDRMGGTAAAVPLLRHGRRIGQRHYGRQGNRRNARETGRLAPHDCTPIERLASG